MLSAIKSKPAIFIDMKKSRIRIHQSTLQLLGNPSYIQLLVNPTAKMIAVKRTIGSDHLSHRIPEDSLQQQKYCELYSRNFLKALRNASSHWKEKETYRIYGTLIEENQLVQFSMEDSIPIQSSLSKEVFTDE